MSMNQDLAVSSSPGDQPPAKKTKHLHDEADRAEQYLKASQPGRVSLNRIYWHPHNRGGQGIMPLHVHDVAMNICTKGTSMRRYGRVRLVEVPEAVKDSWLEGVRKKVRMNPLLAKLPAISHSGPWYANLSCTHFCEAQKIVQEGSRHYRGLPQEKLLQRMEADREGALIESSGVMATVYGEGLWHDHAALMAIMREDNLDAEIAKSETELDAFGTAHTTISNLIEERVSDKSKILTMDDVMKKLEETGLGNLPCEEWKHLVHFRLLMPKNQATMLLDCLFQVVNGQIRISPKTYGDIANLHPKGHSWPKVFLLMETYTANLLQEDTGMPRVRAISHNGPTAPLAKGLEKGAIRELGREGELLAKVINFFKAVVKHYSRPNENGASEEQIMLANAVLMKALGRGLWKIAQSLVDLKNKQKDLQKKGCQAKAVIDSTDYRGALCHTFGESRCLPRWSRQTRCDTAS